MQNKIKPGMISHISLYSASMVNQDAPAQPGAGMNLDKGEKTGNL